ncbi:DUF397 domain-containing protein [Streptomyces sp. PRKS01-29]|nr:DUF397 domain-containing protein [Streptomyces sabulosicollis]MBI0297696.1 DUF397 domain-containing protein [Streptomyces sabulosicollis]
MLNCAEGARRRRAQPTTATGGFRPSPFCRRCAPGRPTRAAELRSRPQARRAASAVRRACGTPPTTVHTRDSKNPDGPRLHIAATAWADFLAFAAR